MQLVIQLSDDQLKTLLEAVVSWEHEPVREAMILSMMKAVITKEEIADPIADAKLKIAEAEAVVRSRKYMSISLQMRLMSVLANPKEHAAP